MCAIAGFHDPEKRSSAGEAELKRMLAVQAYRGPDSTGVHAEPGAGLGHARLAMVGLASGAQPLSSEDGNVWVVCAGEIFNHQELRVEMQRKGHRFATESDCETVVHLYEEAGMDCLARLNGQFAIALWDRRRGEFFLARDRFGILPLHYAFAGTTLVFSSEAKGIFAFPGMSPEPDLKALDQIFSFWSPAGKRTLFKGVSEVPPGHYLRIRAGRPETIAWWRLGFDPAEGPVDEADLAERFRDLLEDAVRLRAAADVPVGAYVSGGIDSAAVAALAPAGLHAFSVTFDDARYDESRYQRLVAAGLGLRLESVRYSGGEAAGLLPDLVRHAETPFLRLSPAPLYLLASRVRGAGFKGVIAGEGADEFLAGYDLFKELKVRRFWSKRPKSARRRLLLNRLYPYLPFVRASDNRFLSQFFSNGLETEADDPFYAHALRWRQAAHLKRFYSEGIREALQKYDAREELAASLPESYRTWEPLAKAQYVEASLLLGRFLLSTQGDRMAMAHGVEVRYPFLDHRVVEFLNAVPARCKMKGLKDKVILRRAMAGKLPEEVLKREKNPYRAPGLKRPAVRPDSEAATALSSAQVKRAGFFDPDLVEGLVAKWERRGAEGLNEMEDMTLNGILTTQLFHRAFLKDVRGAGIHG